MTEMVDPRTSPTPPPRSPEGPSRARDGLARLAVLAVVVLLWWLVCDALAGDTPVLGRMGPGSTARALGDMLGEPATATDTAASLRRLLAGLALATAAGIPLGLLLGLRSGVERATSPVVAVLRMTSPLAWAPLAVVLFGVGDAPVLVLVALAAVWPVTLTNR